MAAAGLLGPDLVFSFSALGSQTDVCRMFQCGHAAIFQVALIGKPWHPNRTYADRYSTLARLLTERKILKVLKFIVWRHLIIRETTGPIYTCSELGKRSSRLLTSLPSPRPKYARTYSHFYKTPRPLSHWITYAEPCSVWQIMLRVIFQPIRHRLIPLRDVRDPRLIDI